MDGNSLHSSSALAEYVATGNTSVTSHPDEQRWSRNENGLKDDVPLTKDYRGQNRKQEAKKNYPRKEDKHRPLKPSAVVSAIIKNASFHYSQISAAPSAGTQSTPMELDTYGYESNERLDTATAQIANLVPSPSLNASAVSEPTVLSRVQLNANVTGEGRTTKVAHERSGKTMVHSFATKVARNRSSKTIVHSYATKVVHERSGKTMVHSFATKVVDECSGKTMVHSFATKVGNECSGKTMVHSFATKVVDERSGKTMVHSFATIVAHERSGKTMVHSFATKVVDERSGKTMVHSFATIVAHERSGKTVVHSFATKVVDERSGKTMVHSFATKVVDVLVKQWCTAFPLK